MSRCRYTINNTVRQVKDSKEILEIISHCTSIRMVETFGQRDSTMTGKRIFRELLSDVIEAFLNKNIVSVEASDDPDSETIATAVFTVKSPEGTREYRLFDFVDKVWPLHCSSIPVRLLHKGE